MVEINRLATCKSICNVCGNTREYRNYITKYDENKDILDINNLIINTNNYIYCD